MSTTATRPSRPHRSALIGAAAAAGCLLTAGLLVPGAGAAPAPWAKAKTTTATLSTSPPSTTATSCSGSCAGVLLEDFEDPRLPGWAGVGWASIGSSAALASHGSRSMVITAPGPSSGATAVLSPGSGRVFVSVALRMQRIPVTGGTAMPGRARAQVVLESADGARTEITDDVRDSGWTTLGGWVSGPSVRVMILMPDRCGTPGDLLVDEVTARVGPSDGGTTTLPASTTSSTVAPAAKTATTTRTNAATSRPATSEPAGCPTGPSTTTRPAQGWDGFEDGTAKGWTALGSSKLAVRQASALDGGFGLRITDVSGTKASGATLTAPLSALPGTGRWVQVSMWVRGAKGGAATSTTAGGQVQPQATTGPVGFLTLLGPDGATIAATHLAGKRWVELSGWAYVPEGTDTLTVAVRQSPQPKCGPTIKPLGVINIDDVRLTRAESAPSSTGSGADRAGAGVSVEGEVAPQGICHVTKY